MKARLAIVMILTFSIFSQCGSESEKIDTIWSKYIKSSGGLQLMKSIKTISYRSKTFSKEGISLEKVQISFPDKVRYELIRPNGVFETIIINGNDGMLMTKNDTVELRPYILCGFKKMGLIFPEIYYKELGYEMSQVYSKSNNDFINILIEEECGDIVYMFDKQTHELVGINPVDYELMLIVEEKKLIDGILFGTKSKSIMGADTTITYLDDYKLNPSLSDSLFRLK